MMKKKFYKGPPRPYLEEAFIREISALGRHPLDEVTVLVPTHLVGQRLLRKVVEVTGGAAGLRFVTFDGLAEDPARSAMAARSLKPLPSRAAMILLGRAAKEELTSDSRLGALLRFRGLPAALWSTVRDLKEARITPDMLADAAGSMPDSVKVEEIAKVWKNYEETKNSLGFCDDKDAQYLALEELDAGPPGLDSPLFIYGIYDATYLQFELLRSYIVRNDAVAFVPWYAKKPAAEFTRPFIELLTGAGFVEAGSFSGGENDPLSEFHGRLFDIDRAMEGISDEGRVRLFTAADPYHEARETVRHLIESCRERNIPFDEVAVILRNGTEYGPLFMEVLEEAGVPCRYAVSYPLARTPGGRALMLLARMIRPDRRDAGTVAEFLEASPLARLPDGSEVPASRWTRIAREAGIVNWMEGYQNRLNSYVRELDEKRGRGRKAEAVEYEIEQAGRLREFMQGLLSGLDNIPPRASWKTIVERFEKIYASYTDESARGAPESLDLLRRMADMSEALQQSSVDEFTEALNHEAAETNVPPEDNAAHGVVMAEVMHARGAVFRAAAIPGVGKGRFPAPVREDPLLLDDERRKLAELLKNQKAHPPDLKERRLLEEKFLFLTAINSAGEQVVISCPRGSSSNGKVAHPSGFFIEALEALKGASLKIEDELEKLKAHPLSPVHVPGRLEHAITYEEALRWLARYNPEGLPEFPFLEDGRKALAAHAGEALTPYDAVIENEEVKEKIWEAIESGRITFSPGKLEKYAKCPFSFFLRNVLGVGPPEEPEDVDEMTALDLGDLYHRVLQAFYRRLRDENLLPLNEKNIEQYHEILEREAGRIFKAVEDEEVAVGKKLMWSLRKENLLEDAKTLLKHDIEDPDWKPGFFEVPIGRAGTEREYETGLGGEEPVSLKFGEDTELFLTGRIDRIDISRDGKSARVIDYKSGKAKSYKKEKLQGGEQIQVALYMKMAEKLLEKSGKKVSEGAYYFVNRTKNEGKFGKREVRKAINNLDEAVSLIVGCIKSGLFHQYADKTGQTGCEDTCEFARACIVTAEKLRRRKHDAPLLEPWNRLKEIE